MTDLELLKAELERQDRELATCFEQMRALDPELQIAVSPDLLEQFSVEPEPTAAHAPWALRV